MVGPGEGAPSPVSSEAGAPSPAGPGEGGPSLAGPAEGAPSPAGPGGEGRLVALDLLSVGRPLRCERGLELWRRRRLLGLWRLPGLWPDGLLGRTRPRKAGLGPDAWLWRARPAGQVWLLRAGPGCGTRPGDKETGSQALHLRAGPGFLARRPRSGPPGDPGLPGAGRGPEASGWTAEGVGAAAGPDAEADACRARRGAGPGNEADGSVEARLRCRRGAGPGADAGPWAAGPGWGAWLVSAAVLRRAEGLPGAGPG